MSGTDIRVQLIASAIAPPLGLGFPPIVLTEQQMHIDVRFFVQSDPLPSGFQGNVRLRLDLVDIGGPFIAVASGLPGFDKERTLARMREEFDRDVPLSIVGEGGAIMQIEIKKFFSEDEHDPPTCIGLYVNLNLRSGPEPTSFFGARGDLALAENFLPKGHHMAFGFARDLYGRLSSDLKERMAAPKEGGGFFYPLDPEDAEVDAGAAKQYRREREQYLKFDLEPSEYADLQLKKILVLEHHGLQIVKMKKRFGGTVYYRDRADKDKGDNLLFLPRYKSQQVTRV